MSKQAIFLNTVSVSHISPCSLCKMRYNPQRRNLHEKEFSIILRASDYLMERPSQRIGNLWWNIVIIQWGR